MNPESPLHANGGYQTREPQVNQGASRNDVKAKIVQIIEVEHVRGGTDNEPLRAVRTYWDFKGNMLAEYDPINDMLAAEYSRKNEMYAAPSRN